MAAPGGHPRIRTARLRISSLRQRHAPPCWRVCWCWHSRPSTCWWTRRGRWRDHRESEVDATHASGIARGTPQAQGAPPPLQLRDGSLLRPFASCSRVRGFFFFFFFLWTPSVKAFLYSHVRRASSLCERCEMERTTRKVTGASRRNRSE